MNFFLKVTMSQPPSHSSKVKLKQAKTDFPPTKAESKSLALSSGGKLLGKKTLHLEEEPSAQGK